MTHPLNTRRYTQFVDQTVPKLQRSLDRLAFANEGLVEALGNVTELVDYREQVKLEAKGWVEEIEAFTAHSSTTEYLDTGAALELLENIATFLDEVVLENEPPPESE